MMMTKRIFQSLLILLSVSVSAQQRYELSVKEAVDLAYKNVIELKNAQIDYKIQEAQNNEIYGRALPQINANAGLQHYIKLPVILFPQSSEPIYRVLMNENLISSSTTIPKPVMAPFSFQQPWNGTAGATLTQLLFQPDVFVGLQARKTALELSNAIIEQTKEKIKDSAYMRYYAILIAEKQLGFLDSSIQRLEKLYHDDSIMYKNGFAERLDLEKVQVQLNNLHTTRNVVANGVLMSYAAMKFALGISQKDTVILKEGLTPQSLKDGILESDFDYSNRPEIKTLEAAKKLQSLDVKRQKLANLPTVAFGANYSVNAMGKHFITHKETTTFGSSYVGLNITAPIFDGFQRKYRIQQARYKLEKLDNNITNIKQVVDLQQTITKESLSNALLNLDTQERNLQLAERVYNTTKKKFEQGLGSSFEVLQADADYQMAQSNYFNALYNATVARIGYQSALGKL